MNEENFGNTKGKIAPAATEAERSVLGCFLLEKDSIIKVVDLIKPEDFYHDHHRFIYEVVLELFQLSQPIDLVTVATKLQAKNKLEIIGGPEFLAEIQNEVPTATHVFQYAQLVKHRSTLRSLINAGQEITALGYEEERSIEELLESAEKRVFSISQTFLKDNAKRAGVCTTDTGLQYEILEAGDGNQPNSQQTVKVHYHGSFIDGQVFDSSITRNEPAEFALDQVIPAWTEALQLMPVGSKWQLYCPSDIAYGPREAGPSIGPYETLIFDVELLEIVKQ